MYIFECGGVFTDGDGNAANTDRAAVKLVDEGLKEALVHFIETGFINVAHGQRLAGNALGDDALGLHLGVITHPAQEMIGDARRAAGTLGDLTRTAAFDRHRHEPRGAHEDVLDLVRRVVVQAVRDAEARAHG